MDEVIETLGFTKSIVDNSLYFLWEEGTFTLIIVIWVNDMIISSYKLGSIIHFKLQFGEYFELTDLDELRYMLGILVEYNHTNHLIYISQKSYLKQFFKHFDISNLHSVSTPLAISNTLSLSQSSQSEENISKYKEFANSIHYLFLIGSLLYATQTCPNIQYTIGQIAQFSRNSGVLYLQTAKHIL